MLFYAKGNFRNWDGLEVKRPAECLWCGHKWVTTVPTHPVCPKCHMTNDLTRKVLADPSLFQFLSRKTKMMKKKSD